jgi:hypothetical protein
LRPPKPLVLAGFVVVGVEVGAVAVGFGRPGPWAGVGVGVEVGVGVGVEVGVDSVGIAVGARTTLAATLGGGTAGAIGTSAGRPRAAITPTTIATPASNPTAAIAIGRAGDRRGTTGPTVLNDAFVCA